MALREMDSTPGTFVLHLYDFKGISINSGHGRLGIQICHSKAQIAAQVIAGLLSRFVTPLWRIWGSRCVLMRPDI